MLIFSFICSTKFRPTSTESLALINLHIYLIDLVLIVQRWLSGGSVIQQEINLTGRTCHAWDGMACMKVGSRRDFGLQS